MRQVVPIPIIAFVRRTWKLATCIWRLVNEQTLHPNRSSFLGFLSLDIELEGLCCVSVSWNAATRRPWNCVGIKTVKSLGRDLISLSAHFNVAKMDTRIHHKSFTGFNSASFIGIEKCKMCRSLRSFCCTTSRGISRISAIYLMKLS